MALETNIVFLDEEVEEEEIEEEEEEEEEEVGEFTIIR